MTRTALVTGGNRGIGLEVCRGLAEPGFRVLLAARDRDEGEAAARSLREGGHDVRACVLDVSDRESIAALVSSLEGQAPIDVVVNNAGTSLDGFDVEVVRRTLAVNLERAIAVTDALAPQLSEDARVVMVSSGMGELHGLPSAIRARFDPPRDRAHVLAAVDEFARAVRAGREREEGWPRSAYRISKVALNAMTRVYAETLRGRARVVAVCPGWVRTRVGGAGASRSPREGAAGIVWAATTPDLETGRFYRDGRTIPW
ncbi:SDR family NAD(P)-dependent oxidoreductase [Sandaracinus amylolyticus]|uniref:Putative oxidoreductase n=1 Tax=Sandaracinus amylolyticus TaxID=927083 RepID=A0A0F6YMX2_9BACT|nr:SDR family NAD(P)-dependent oxidoreductase [Sandaracinus amylolyticus]AKF09722.1 putative oxidoreductase [Sandaracinus amylolyticus]